MVNGETHDFATKQIMSVCVCGVQIWHVLSVILLLVADRNHEKQLKVVNWDSVSSMKIEMQ